MLWPTYIHGLFMMSMCNFISILSLNLDDDIQLMPAEQKAWIWIRACTIYVAKPMLIAPDTNVHGNNASLHLHANCISVQWLPKDSWAVNVFHFFSEVVRGLCLHWKCWGVEDVDYIRPFIFYTTFVFAIAIDRARCTYDKVRGLSSLWGAKLPHPYRSHLFHQWFQMLFWL